jgi:uncharacterized repeat protein (TIGR01451 family)
MKKNLRYFAPFLLALALLAMTDSVVAGRLQGFAAGIEFSVLQEPSVSSPETSLAPVKVESAGGVIEPHLLRILAETEPDAYVRVILYLREQADVESAAAGGQNAVDARSRVVSVLRAQAERSQAPLRAYLKEVQTTGAVASYTPFWIVNAIAVRARPPVIRDLAARPEVAIVRLDHYRQWLPPQPANQLTNQPTIEWNIDRIRADEVWHALHISGTGAVVAGMDTGVDWLHPALQVSYRGYNPRGPSNHTYSWYDATGDGALYPVDGHGHGSHTIGIIVGQDGIGVAPGAQWIAVRALDSKGQGFDSWFHAGFQWLLAPGGDPSKAPDVINGSWGNDSGGRTALQGDLRALRAAGILLIFASGNAGPQRGTVGWPASLPEVFAVGATDEYDEITSFSSRGPSPWGEIRPHVVAPGVDVRSSLPGGAYRLGNGTSQAAPHVSGVVALLRSLDPTLSITRAAYLITSTAVPLGDVIPNNDTGWGRVDAFAAVAALAHPGFISGTVTRIGDGAPIAGARVSARHYRDDGGGATSTADDGHYLLTLAPATYDLNASVFGYQPTTLPGIEVATDTVTVIDLALAALPTGLLSGLVVDAVTEDPVTATITVLDTPIELSSSAYTVPLPAGDYTVRAQSPGYRVVTATVQITVGQTTTLDFALPPAPAILLVDSGWWYYESEVGYFRQALDDLAYAYDEWPIRHLPDDVPTASDLTPYNIVIWTAPWDAPGYIGAQSAITGYLSSGGHLLLSGQDIGFLDGGGSGWLYAPYYTHYLKAYFSRDNAPTRNLEGVAGDIFAGLTLTITGAGGADNQVYPDVVGITDPDAAASVLHYYQSGCGGVRVGTCLDYRAIYLSFGFEAINDRVTRREVMERAIQWLETDPPEAALGVTPVAQIGVGSPGAIVTHTLRVRHLGQRGITDTVNLALNGASWDSQLSAAALTLAPCTSDTVVVTVTVPVSAAWDVQDVMTLTARSTLSPTLVQSAVITTKAPAPILLVDDDRWYDQAAKYKAALAESSLPYDYWYTGRAGDEPPQGSPPLGVVQLYPIVVWFTGYDWYAPVTDEEGETLAAYLDDGGRLFLSSQDFLYYNYEDLLSQSYLGVLTYTESATPTLAVGVPENPIGDRLEKHHLSYPFTNWSDTVVPVPGAGVPIRDQNRKAIGLARQDGGYRTVFFSFPFEVLPENVRPVVMERVVGWLSWLGRSTFASDRVAALPGDVLTYTAVLYNDGPVTVTASLSNTLPVSLTLVPGSLAGPASYTATARRITWAGTLFPDSAVTITYQVTAALGLPAGASVANPVRLGLEDQSVRFHRMAVVRMNAPDLAPSTLTCDPHPARPGSVATCTLTLVNAGPGDASAAVINPLPTGATLITDSLVLMGGGIAEVLTNTLHWEGPLAAGKQVTIVYQLALPSSSIHPHLYTVAFLEDDVGGAWERSAWVILVPYRCYLPLMLGSNYSGYSPQ